jgi:exopolyphosphatase / guanosine-5'-triphosphate,3'-diphosphate pyrophosphatase
VDIGGGSTEIVHQSGAAISLDIGSVRLSERHVRSDPPSATELARVRADIESALDHAPAFPPGSTLVGVAGTVTTIAAISLELTSYDGASVHGVRISSDEISRVARLLESMTISERLKLAGLEPQRADVIVVGAGLLEAVARRAGVAELVVSDRGVRWGLAESVLAEPA